jgi:sugar phosphate isomerase/epimerase
VTVQLGLTPDGRWDIDTAGLIESAHLAGFSTVGLSARRANPEAAAAYQASGVECHELLAFVLSDDESRTLAGAERLAEAAAVVGARWVLTTFLTGLTGETTKLVQRCAAMFADAGAGMAVEFSPLGAVTSIQSGLEVVAAAGAGQAGLMIDAWHFSFGDSTWDDLAGVPLEQVAYVQFADALAPISDDRMEETMQRRALPGEGILELDRFASTLLERGFDGVVSVEVLSRELRRLPVPEFARRAHEATARYWR